MREIELQPAGRERGMQAQIRERCGDAQYLAWNGYERWESNAYNM